MSVHTSPRCRAITGIAAVASAITLSSAGSAGASSVRVAAVESVLQVPSATGTNTSPNWAGAIHTSTTDGTFQGVSGVWQVPTVSGSDGYSCTWVGIDGYGDDNLIQTGTEEDVVNGQPTYDAWMEILPDEPSEQKIYAADGSLEPVQPGDEMWAYVGQTADPTVWTVYLEDLTQNWTFDQTFTYDGPGRSAEWIQEGTTEDGVIQAPANFGEVTISNLYEAENGQWLAAQVSDGDLLAQQLGDHPYAIPDEPTGSGQQYVTVRYNSL